MKIVEIFSSLQGEGKNQGRPTTFVRFSGCNLRCAWCDTPESQDGKSGEEMTYDEVIGEIKKNGFSHICITGGEPLLWIDELVPLLGALDSEGYIIDIETNGTIDPAPLMDFASVCMDVKCPSSGEVSDLSLLKRLRNRDSVKFVVSGREDLEYAEDVIISRGPLPETFVSPVSGSDYRAVSDYILDKKLPCRMQVQLHKIIGVK